MDQARPHTGHRPHPLAQLSALTRLDLGSTQVTDLTPLAQLSALTRLYLRNTQITDLTPLAQLSALTALSLSNTQVSDLAPLMHLSALATLSIDDTQVSDLRPLIPLEKLGEGDDTGLAYNNTPASRSTPELQRLSQVENNNYAKCYRDTVAYLKTLPPYPEPLPWDRTTDAGEGDEDPPIPGNRPAPLQVVEEDGILRPARPGDALEIDASRLAEQGWAALREFLEDLACQRERIANSMPQLGKALARLETALGPGLRRHEPGGDRHPWPARHPPIRARARDAHGGRCRRHPGVRRRPGALSGTLPDWRSYRDEAAASQISEQDAIEAIPDVQEITRSLEGLPEIDPVISSELEALTQDVLDEPADRVVRAGLVSSVGNLLAALASRALVVLKACKREAGEITTETWSQSKKLFSKTAGTTIGVAAAGLFIGGFATLTGFAVRFSAQLPWLENFLKFVGGLGL